jgi:acetyl esterase/lipase
LSEVPQYLRPFVLRPPSVLPVREGNLDFYLPAGDGEAAAVVLVHGGPVPEGRKPTPRDWPVYRGYGSAVAGRGLVGTVLDHRFHDFELIKEAGEDIVSAVDRVRKNPGVDPDRLGMWFFSGGGALMGNWLSQPPSWLRCVAASYPVCPTQDELGAAAIAPREAVRSSDGLPILLSRAGLERIDLAKWVDDFISSAREAGANLDIIDVPQGQHAFDVLDHTDWSRAAIEEALVWICAHLLN